MAITDYDIDSFLAIAQAAVAETRPEYRVSAPRRSSKFIRIEVNEERFYGIDRSVFCFVERSTGNVLKADGWKRPAKGVRSNIFDADGGASGITAYGAVYR